MTVQGDRTTGACQAERDPVSEARCNERERKKGPCRYRRGTWEPVGLGRLSRPLSHTCSRSAPSPTGSRTAGIGGRPDYRAAGRRDCQRQRRNHDAAGRAADPSGQPGPGPGPRAPPHPGRRDRRPAPAGESAGLRSATLGRVPLPDPAAGGRGCAGARAPRESPLPVQPQQSGPRRRPAAGGLRRAGGRGPGRCGRPQPATAGASRSQSTTG